ncbi:MAG: NAD(P)/FAD-dependent oxidoreductase [Candidatus Mcinerneyibacterium aminivorans]|uniref:NAD(P)/FAD-dependent oxidoreductase n=1 Tax=Candidatus Mcinerneyibacterium aminivorans TaxID=2703815 RepID=A0A5D0MKC7_9BACT|nr:MAG: NAD(P)/FAD-dependent oxidoreductase [Candidatus Mcinerneyibacterium aminivorans]
MIIINVLNAIYALKFVLQGLFSQRRRRKSKVEKYDTVVIGGGPAGSIAARTIAEKGFKVLLLEKRQEFGRPVRCAEGVSKKWLEKYTDIKDKWISRPIKGAILKSPGGKKALMQYNESDRGYILDRSVFDFDLAVEASESGATVRTKNRVERIERNKDSFKIYIEGFNKYIVESKTIIAADGVEGKIPRMLGINTILDPGDIEFGLNYQLEGVDINQDYIEMIGGNELAPGGYVWIFPKGEHSANVGLGVLASRSTKEKNAKYFLDKFVSKRFPEASISKVVAGAVTVAKPLKKMYGNSFLIVGDSARLSNPLTGAGIGNALESGALAGETISKALEKNDFSENNFKEYQKKVMKSVGNTSKKFYHIKEAFIKFSDKDIDDMITLLSQVDPEKLNLKKLLTITFKNNKEIISLLKKIVF